MGATAAIANLVPHTGHVILADDGYYGAQRYFGHISRDQHGIGLDYVDFSMLDELKAALKPNTKVDLLKI
jgi:cystathionine beta-lyase/cystathionine gamma-synthase